MELMPNFKLEKPETMGDAIKLSENAPGALYVAGGTDMVVNIRRGIERPDTLIDLSCIKDLKVIKENKDNIEIGAAVTLKELANNSIIRREYPCIAEAAKSVAGPTHQQYGTVGGNLCLDTRCLFYNQSEWWRQSNDYCLKKLGDTCHVAPGGKRCFAAFSGDIAPAMLVYDSQVMVLSSRKEKKINLPDLYQNDGMAHLNLKAGELVTSIHLPRYFSGDVSRYEKARIRGSIDFPLAGAAVRLKVDKSKIIENISIALTAVNPYPQLVHGLDKFVGQKVEDEVLDKIRDTVRKQAKPMRTTTVAPWYRRRVIGAITRRMIKELAA